jgi:hypothetical protein
MKFYAEAPAPRRRQIIGDALFGASVLVFVLIGRGVHGLVSRLAVAGRLLEGAGADLTRSAEGTGQRVGDVPALGDRLAAPFGAVADGGAALADAGQAQQGAVATVALVVAVLVAGPPIVWLLATYVPARVWWVRQAGAATDLLRSTGGDATLFALRALANQPLRELRRISADPVGDYERGDPGVTAALAALELRTLGVAPPEPAKGYAT